MEKTVLVIGGAYQDKTKAALEYLKLSESALKEGELLENFASFYRKWENSDDALLDFLKNKITVCDEMGCGIVPLDKNDRDFRENLGRFLCRLAERADIVLRVQCGIAAAIKGE